MRIFRAGPAQGSTFSDLKLDPPLDPSKPEEWVARLREAVKAYKDERFAWYLGQMRQRSGLVNGLPGISAVLGVIGILSTSGAVVVRTLSLATVIDWPTG